MTFNEVQCIYNLISRQNYSYNQRMELKVKRARVFSAKYPNTNADRIRPMSGVSTQHYKQELIQNIYTSQTQSANPNRGVSAKTQPYGRYSIIMENQQKKLQRPTVRQSKPKQEMVEQIMNLKQTVNKLVQQLSQQKGKAEVMKRKNSKYSKVLTMEFENEQQWGSHTVSSHLVTGIKAMYDNLKQKFQNKCKYCQWLTTKVETTNFLQMNSYIEILQKNNKQLMRRLETVLNNSKQIPVYTEAQKLATTYTLNELKFQNETLVEKIRDLQKSLKDSSNNNKDMDKKILFIQKLLIEKDNNVHALTKKVKQGTSQIKRLKQDLEKIKQKYQKLDQQYNREKCSNQNKFNDITSRYERQIKEQIEKKNKIINGLEKKNYESQQTIIDLRKNNIQLKSQLQNLQEEKVKLSFKQSQGVVAETYKKTIISEPKVQIKSKKSTINIKNDGKREPQRADKRHSQNALKKRKVQQLDVVQIAELIRYKLIGKKVPLQFFKNLFDKNQNKRYNDPQWSEQYTTMEEVLQILTDQPLSLGEDPAFLLARYLIEDVNAQYIYCDLQNENSRQIIKSIIKALIKNYSVFQSSELEKQSQLALSQYGQNLSNTLKTLYRQGYVSREKFQSIIKSLGIEISQQAREILIAKMAIKSNDINELPYKVLFD